MPPPEHFCVATPPSCPNAHFLSARGRSGVTVAVSNTDPPGLGMLTLPFSPPQHQPGTEHSAVCTAMTISFWKKKSWPFGGICGLNVIVSTQRGYAVREMQTSHCRNLVSTPALRWATWSLQGQSGKTQRNHSESSASFRLINASTAPLFESNQISFLFLARRKEVNS